MPDKQQKLRRIRSLLRADRSVAAHPGFLDARKDPAPRLSGGGSEATSSHNYPDPILAEIDRLSDGWVLDCGCGSRPELHENVVCFDIAPFPGVDVVGDATDLPFADDSFDFIISLSVFEHIKDPNKAASELARVLRPGGRLWIDTAFMQPYHAFPNHYFNMTQHGLRSLFERSLDIEQEFVPSYGTAIWSLAWSIKQYARELSGKAREEFLKTPLEEFLKPTATLLDRSFAQPDSDALNRALAATVSLVARKPLPAEK